ncbi:MAG: NAD-dependent epimerase/dehydratase family protein [Candidatus Komeilibacteria bacterium]
MRILVTGGAGFIGSHLVERLLALGHQVAVLDNLSTGKREYVPPEAVFYNIDLLTADLKQCIEEFEPEVIYHLAAQKNLRLALADPIADAQINVIGSLRLLQAAAARKPRLIFSSSAAVYGEHTLRPEEGDQTHPINPYGITKKTLEHYLLFYQLTHGLPVTIFRFANVYGPRQDPAGEAGVISLLINCALKGQEFVVNGDGQQTRDYTYVDDMVTGLVQGLEREGIYNLGTNQETSIMDLVKMLETLHEKEIIRRHSEPIVGEVKRFVYSAQKARQQLLWEPRVNLNEGLRRTYNWQKQSL